MKITIPGEPAAAARPRFSKKTGKAYSPKGNVEYIERVRLACVDADAELTFGRGELLMLSATFFFPHLKSHYGTGKNASKLKAGTPVYAIGSKDLDNLLKLVKDGLQQAGVIFNDNQIVRYGVCEKRYAEIGLTVVTIESIPSEAALTVVGGGRAEGQAAARPARRKAKGSADSKPRRSTRRSGRRKTTH